MNKHPLFYKLVDAKNLKLIVFNIRLDVICVFNKLRHVSYS